jgi:malignant T-cell-amplified sequence
LDAFLFFLRNRSGRPEEEENKSVDNIHRKMPKKSKKDKKKSAPFKKYVNPNTRIVDFSTFRTQTRTYAYARARTHTHTLNRFGKEEIVARNLVKSSVRRFIRNTILEQYKMLEEDEFEHILPNKSKAVVLKCQNDIQVVLLDSTPLFFNIRGGPFFPTLKLLHQFPKLLPAWQVDTGAINFVLAGANIMCPGFTSEGGLKNEARSVKNVKLEEGVPVAIYAEGKTLPIAMGLTKMSSDDVVETNKGTAVANYHYLGDDLWAQVKIE